MPQLASSFSGGNFNPTNVGLKLQLRTIAPDLLVGLESRLRHWTLSPPLPAGHLLPRPGLSLQFVNCAL